ncbi:coiled-coil domain-containing protein [Selenomonas dianae]|uniref:Tat pathway signal sequence domain protein n=1 Tax=Selenomonas dianae TaxID=135079 RepID=A0ABN0SVX1_9FIRM|nr:peroxidase [Selenomonas dianae]WLD82766.1 peroxidase [Selenomonas dianae]
MSMVRKTLRRRSVFLRPAAAAACAVYLAGAAHSVYAASHDTLHDVPGYLSYMMNVEGEIRSYHAAVDALAQAKIDLANARHNLDEARAAKADAAQNLELVGRNLRAAEDHLAAVRIALGVAEEESAARTREAIAAQQAEADYAPTVYAQRTQMEGLYAQANALAGVSGGGSDASARRAEVVARVLDEVGYEQNRIVDAQIMVEAALAGGVSGVQDNSAAFAAISAQVDAAQARLDAVESQFDALITAREAAEDAERDARERVADYQQEITASEADLTQLRSDRVEAENYDAATKKWTDEAVRDEAAAVEQLARSEHDLKYLGEGRGYQTGAEYYAWHGERAGHQFYLPLSYFARTHAGKTKLDYGLSTGYVKSSTGFENGSVSGWTDTQLSVTLRNEKKINSVNYGFGISMPTGQNKIYQRSTVPEGLARFTDFGAGWQVTPSIEVIHKITERDRLTARIAYNIRNGYDYAKESDALKNVYDAFCAQHTTIWGSMYDAMWNYCKEQYSSLTEEELKSKVRDLTGRVANLKLTEEDRVFLQKMSNDLGKNLTPSERVMLENISLGNLQDVWKLLKQHNLTLNDVVLDHIPNAHTSPGDIFSQELEYLHAGEKQQYMVQLYHNSTTRTSQYAIIPDYYYIDEATKKLHLGWKKNYYRDGDDWELRFFYNHALSKHDELRFYSIYALTEAASGIASQSIARQYYGLGLRHRVSDKLAWLAMAHYARVNNTSDPLRTALNTGGGFRRTSLVGGVEWKLSERQNFTFQLERFVRSDDGGFGYNGWAFTLWYQEVL